MKPSPLSPQITPSSNMPSTRHSTLISTATWNTRPRAKPRRAPNRRVMPRNSDDNTNAPTTTARDNNNFTRNVDITTNQTRKRAQSTPNPHPLKHRPHLSAPTPNRSVPKAEGPVGPVGTVGGRDAGNELQG
ncbi:hypothetical protein GCM10023339_68150 [Alloalcanivorax gelatiniphagus]